MRRLPVILWLHILGELWRLILLTTCILVTVLSFAAAVRFLADGRLGVVETIRWMFLAMPPMLQYALPFAAGFGATMAYHRVCADNELVAQYAAGVSHRSILMPAFASGVVLSIAVLVLSNWVFPRFLRSAEELVARDAARMIVNSIERKEAVKLGDMLLYADLVRRYPGTEEQKYERLYLQGVMVVGVDKEGVVKSVVSASEADVWLQRVERSSLPNADVARLQDGETLTHVTIRTKGMVGERRDSRFDSSMNVFSRFVPNAFTDDPKFLSWGELKAMKREPERLSAIDSKRRALAAQLAERMVTKKIEDSIANEGRVLLAGDEDVTFTIHARSVGLNNELRKWVFNAGVGADGRPSPILVERAPVTGRKIRQFADIVAFDTAANSSVEDLPVAIELTLTGLVTAAEGANSGAGGVQLKPQTIGDLVMPAVDVQPTMKAGAFETLAAAEERLRVQPDDPDMIAARRELDRRVSDLLREILSKQHERFASAAACLVMIVTGGVMAIKLRSKLPLAVYLWAFFPALAATITVSMGQQMIHANGLLGAPVMWGGVVGLAIFTFVQYRQVARN